MLNSGKSFKVSSIQYCQANETNTKVIPWPLSRQCYTTKLFWQATLIGYSWGWCLLGRTLLRGRSQKTTLGIRTVHDTWNIISVYGVWYLKRHHKIKNSEILLLLSDSLRTAMEDLELFWKRQFEVTWLLSSRWIWIYLSALDNFGSRRDRVRGRLLEVFQGLVWRYHPSICLVWLRKTQWKTSVRFATAGILR